MLDTILQEYMRLSGTVGMSVAIADADTLLYSRGFGWANAEEKKRVTPRTIFRTASVAKIITASLLGQLMQEGKIDIDRPINQYLRKKVPHGNEITARMLVSHTAGIRHYIDSDFTRKNIDMTRYKTLEDALSIFVNDSLVSPPGTQFHYTTFGFTLLGVVMEAVTGQPFINRMQDMLNELGMYNTVPNLRGLETQQESQGYSVGKDGRLQKHKLLKPSYKWPGGGYLSTPEDLTLLGRAYLNCSFISDTISQQIFTPQVTKTGDTLGIGLGWVVGKDAWNRPFYFHNGGQNGARTLLAIYPQDSITVGIMSNTSNQPLLIEGVGACLVDILVNKKGIAGKDTTLLGDYDYFIESDTLPPKGAMVVSRDASGNYFGSITDLPGSKFPTVPLMEIALTAKSLKAKIVTSEGIYPFEVVANGTGLHGWILLQQGQEGIKKEIWMRRKIQP